VDLSNQLDRALYEAWLEWANRELKGSKPRLEAAAAAAVDAAVADPEQEPEPDLEPRPRPAADGLPIFGWLSSAGDGDREHVADWAHQLVRLKEEAQRARADAA